jgi:hypothetical protein
VIHPRIDARDKAICGALATVASQPTRIGDSAWRFTLVNVVPHVITAKADDDWLLFEADCCSEAQQPELFWDALERSASLAGLAKLALAQDGVLQVRAEVPVLEGVELATRIRQICNGFKSYWSDTVDPGSAGSLLDVDATPIDLKRLCGEAGWPFGERGGGKLAVELEVLGSFHQALLFQKDQGVRISCELATCDTIPEKCRPAVGGLLLSVSGLVRMGRACVNASRETPAAQLEVSIETAPSPIEISSALESLSVGCSLCGEEIKALQVPAIAERYLTLRGWGAKPAARRNERTVST